MSPDYNFLFIVGTVVPTIMVGTAVPTIIVLMAYYWKSCKMQGLEDFLGPNRFWAKKIFWAEKNSWSEKNLKKIRL